MNKIELVREMAKKTETSQVVSKQMIEALMEVITDTLVAGDSVKISGFGTFEVRDRSARTGVNPQTGEAIEIEARKAPAFKPSAQLKAALN